MDNIELIPIEYLEHHPENPRSDLGDLHELSNSIAAQGILQNLTVIPVPGQKNKYWVVIGNRRLDASKQAGLTELPCRVAEMSEQEALKTMMSENMQRTDLTVMDQINGIGNRRHPVAGPQRSIGPAGIISPAGSIRLRGILMFLATPDREKKNHQGCEKKEKAFHGKALLIFLKIIFLPQFGLLLLRLMGEIVLPAGTEVDVPPPEAAEE